MSEETLNTGYLYLLARKERNFTCIMLSLLAGLDKPVNAIFLVLSTLLIPDQFPSMISLLYILYC